MAKLKQKSELQIQLASRHLLDSLSGDVKTLTYDNYTKIMLQASGILCVFKIDIYSHLFGVPRLG